MTVPVPGSEPDEPPKRVTFEHLVATALAVLVAGGTFGGVRISSKFDEQSEAHTRELKAEAKESRERAEVRDRELTAEIKGLGSKLTEFQVSLTEIKTQFAASDKATDRVVNEQGRQAAELRDQAKQNERATARLEEHERRLAALEQQRGK